MPLNDRQIRNAKPAEAGKKAKLFDGGGLYLEVTPAGGKIFRLKYRIGGKEKTLTIGKYPAVSLSEARQAAENARRLLVSGQDPSEAKQQEKRERQAAALNTFESIARRWHTDNLHRWKENHAARIISDFEKDVFPAIGEIQITEISVSDVKAVISAIIARGATVTALGIPAKLLNTRKHQPCPHCGGKDRFRYTDHKHGGGYICNQCTPEGGSGFDLLMLVFGYSLTEAVNQVSALLGLSDGLHGQYAPTPRPRYECTRGGVYHIGIKTDSGKYEDQTIIAQAEAFMSIHAHGMRFSDWSDHHTNHEHAGYRKQAGEDTEYWINPPTFEIEICGSYDKAKTCEVLHAVGWLLKAENGRWQHQRKRNGTASRYYVLKNEAPPETEE